MSEKLYVVRDFAKELVKVIYDGNIGKVAEIFRLLELALERNKRETVQLLIEYIERFHGDIEALMGRKRGGKVELVGLG
ncbi:MAG: hypothetical protein GU346_06610 [Thermocrinis sp.]|jgi:hypothetical protein|nr:hypothetical protein [Thermocrinis sp.]